MQSNTQDKKDRFQTGQALSWWSILANLLLVALKLVAGLVGNSSAMVADAIHSASDILTTLGVIVSFQVSKRPPDSDHPYGHGKAESVAAKLLGAVLLFAGGSLAWSALKTIAKGEFAEPGAIALIAALVSIAAKETMYQVTISTARRINSSALAADAWHHRSDAYSSIGTLVGVFGARKGFPILDPLAGVVVAGFVIAIGWKTLRTSADELMDAQDNPELVQDIRSATQTVQGVEDIHMLATRRYGGSYHIDLRVGVDPGLSVVDGHEITIAIEQAVRRACPQVTVVLVHVDPESMHEHEHGDDTHWHRPETADETC